MNTRIAALVLMTNLTIAGIAQTQIVDPFEVIAAFDHAAETDLWPGFEATAYPIAVYDGERTLLLRHPSPPEEFVPLEGHEGVRVSQGRHPAMRWNSNAEIGGVRTATLLLTIEPGRAVEYEAHILFHEVFHLYSKPLHPSWRPNELFRYSYPMADLENYRLQLLEEEALARAVESETAEATASWAATALAIRSQRMARLSDEHKVFETALELQEGTAVYMGRSTIGTAADTERLREERGAEGIRWRCYETGAAMAVVLDRLLPSWKEVLDAEPETTFADLLSASLAAREGPPATLTAEEQAAVAHRAEVAVARLAAERASLYEDFAARSKRVIIRLADANESLEVVGFDPMAVEVLDRSETLQAHLLSARHPRAELDLNNPHFVRGSMEGVIALTVPAGTHPFLDGLREVSVTGFLGDPKIEVDGDTTTVTAEGLSGSFTGALVEPAGDALIITVPPGELDEKSSGVTSED